MILCSGRRNEVGAKNEEAAFRLETASCFLRLGQFFGLTGRLRVLKAAIPRAGGREKAAVRGRKLIMAPQSDRCSLQSRGPKSPKVGQATA